MYKIFFFFSLFAVASMGCGQHCHVSPAGHEGIAVKPDTLLKSEKINATIGEGLLLTQYESLGQLKSVVRITYMKDSSGVCLSSRCRDHEVTNELKTGLGQADFERAKNGNFLNQLWLGLRCPFAVFHKRSLASIGNLGRRKFGVHGDVAFYDLAETMVQHISDEDRVNLSEKDLSEKGYLNTFEHIITSALMTSMYSQSVAEFVGDAHERSSMPELMTGKFTPEQLADVDDGPVDNYLDIINNEWGQELGKVLRQKYNINQDTRWTPQLLADYLNDIESYHSWVFRIAFRPYTPEEEIVVRFAKKMNTGI